MQVTICSIKENTDAKITVIAEDDFIPNVDKTINVCGKLFTDEMSPNKNTPYTQMSLARLFAPQYVEDDKVLYLDSDCVVLKSIDELFEIDLKDNLFAGVIEPSKSSSEPYFNAGVLLLNLKQWREENITEKVMNIINKKFLRYPDQDALNIIGNKRAIQLDCKYNSNMFCGESVYPSIWHYAWKKPHDARVHHPEYWLRYEKH